MPGFKSDQSTGLLGHYVGTIETSFAGTDAQYQDGTVARITWETSVDDVLQQDYDGIIPESMPVNVTLGKGWDTDDDGILFHEDDEARIAKGLEVKDFKISSYYGNLIALVAGETNKWSGKFEVIDGGEDIDEVDLTEVLAYFEAQGYDDPRDAHIWEGLTFEFRQVRFEMRNGDTYNRTLPVRLVATPGQNKPKNTKRAAKTEPVEEVLFDFAEYGADVNLEGKLNDILNSARNQSDFVKKAIAVDGVADNEALMAILVSDEGPWSLR